MSLGSLSACVAGAALLAAHLAGLDPRSPSWIWGLQITRPWTGEKAECEEGGRCVIPESTFWSPKNNTKGTGVFFYFYSHCSPQMSSRHQAIAAALHRRYLRRSSLFGGSKPSLGLIQIGAHILSDGEVGSLMLLNAASGDNARLALVEPQEPIIKDLTTNALKVGLGPERTRVVNAALCPSDDQELTLWKFNDTVAPDGPRSPISPNGPRAEYRKWTSLGGKDVLISTWQTFKFLLLPEHRHEEDITDWIESVPVKCFTAASLLKELRMEASDVDYLFIDAEGSDAEILAQFRDLPGFNPAAIVFEFAFLHATAGKLHLVAEAATYWAQKGYAVHKDMDNVIIFKTDGS